jgi:CRISPR/Cas system CMR subunit Cmr6 (Cas7 group RAMP superfamily)
MIAQEYRIKNNKLMEKWEKEFRKWLRTENENKLQHKRMKNSELNELKLKSRERLNWFWAHNIIKCLKKTWIFYVA